MKVVTATDARRRLSSILKAVQAGESYTIVSRGEAVATLIPPGRDAAMRRAAHERLMERLRSQPALGLGPFNRDELYDDVNG